jgi:hypothetical protein
MGEMKDALRTIRALPSNVLIKNPAGSWSFVGSVDIRLSFTMKDGAPVDEKTAKNIASSGPGFCNVKRVTWATEKEARDYAASLGLKTA